MPYLIVNKDNSISDVVADNVDGSVLVDDISIINKNPYGHTVFDYVDGEIVLNSAKVNDLNESKEKDRLTKKLIEIEKDKAIRNLVLTKEFEIKNMTLSEMKTALSGA